MDLPRPPPASGSSRCTTWTWPARSSRSDLRSIEVKAANGRNWVLKLQPGVTNVKVGGSAEPEMLTPGTCVRFVARIDKRTSKGQEKIASIMLFNETPGVTERTLGVELAGERPQGNEDDPNAAGLPLGPDAGTGILDDGAAGGKSSKRRGPAAKGPDKSVPDVAAYDVCAEIVSYQRGRLTVSVQNRFLKPKITVELAPDAQIGLDLDDLSLAKPGDKISATGYYATPGLCEQVDSVEVTLSNPLAPPGSRPRRPRAVAGSGDAAQPPGGKAKTGAAATTGKKAPAAGTATEKAPAKVQAEEKGLARDLPPARENSPARVRQDVEPDPAPPDLAPPVEQARPEPKKPLEKPQPTKPEKKPPVDDDDDKNAFD